MTRATTSNSFFFVRHFVCVLVLLLFVLSGFSQTTTTGNVFFFGVGIENTKAEGVPSKALAKADVNAVLEKTRQDLLVNRMYFTSVELNKRIRFTDVVSTCLYDDKATMESIDSVFNDIASKANPYDIFYFYISAPSDDKTGSFYLPSKPQKKGSKITPSQSVLDPQKLETLFAKIRCRNQLVLVDAASWKTFHGTLLPQFFQNSASQKNQVLIVPGAVCADTFTLVDNKKVSLLPAIVCNTDLPLLIVFDDDGMQDLEIDLIQTSFAVSKKKGKLLVIYSSATLNNASVIVDNNTPGKGTTVQQVIGESNAPELKSTVAPAVKPKPSSTATATRGPVAISAQKEMADSVFAAIKNYALIIGVSDYQDSAWHDLPNPVPDAMALNDELKNHFGFETTFLPNPTKSELWDAITLLSSMNFDQNSQVLVFFAGHGGMGAVEGYIVPADGKNPVDDKTMSSFITYSYLRSVISSIRSKHVLVILDACYSGTFDEDVMVASRSAQDNKKQELDNLRLIREKMKYKFKGYISSGGKETVSDGKPGEHSPFISSILDCLRNGYSSNQVVTFTELAATVESVTTPVPRWGVISKEPGGDFLFIPQPPKKK